MVSPFPMPRAPMGGSSPMGGGSYNVPFPMNRPTTQMVNSAGQPMQQPGNMSLNMGGQFGQSFSAPGMGQQQTTSDQMGVSPYQLATMPGSQYAQMKNRAGYASGLGMSPFEAS